LARPPAAGMGKGRPYTGVEGRNDREETPKLFAYYFFAFLPSCAQEPTPGSSL